MHVRTLSITSALCVVLLVALFNFVRPGRYLANCEYFVAKLPKDRMHGLARFAHPSGSDGEFIEASGGLKGVLQWLAYSAAIVCLLQVNVYNRKIPLAHACDVYQDALIQAWYTLWAIPEAALGVLYHRLSHPAARMAFEYHYALSLRATTLFGFDGAPPSILNNGRLL